MFKKTTSLLTKNCYEHKNQMLKLDWLYVLMFTRCFSYQILKDVFVFLPSVLWLEVVRQQTRRVTVLGCQDGHVKVAVTELSSGPSMFNLFKFLLEPL